MMFRRICISMVLLFVLGISFTPGSLYAQDDSSIRVLEVDDKTPKSDQPRAVNRILATVGDRAITLADYKRAFGTRKLTKSNLVTLIERWLIRESSRNFGIILQRDRVRRFVDEKLKKIKKRAGDRFSRLLKKKGMTLEEYRKTLEVSTRDRLLKDRVLVRHFPRVVRPDTGAAFKQVKARLMILPDSSTAWKVHRTLRDSPTLSTWEQLYEKHSQKPGFVDEGGRLDWFFWGHYNKTIEYEIFRHERWQLSDPFKVRGSWAIVLPAGNRLSPSPPPNFRQTLRTYKSYLRKKYSDQLI
ncbi:MAG: hypothetical protein ABEJ65_02215, partial [bacterium]